MDNSLVIYNYTSNFTKKNYTLRIGAKKLANMCSKNSSPDACKQIKKQTLLNKVPRRSMLLDVLRHGENKYLDTTCNLGGQDLMGNTGGSRQCLDLMKVP